MWKKGNSPACVFLFSVLLVLLFLLAKPAYVSAQYQDYLDSLKIDLANTKVDSSKALKLNVLSTVSLDQGEQMEYAQRALVISEKADYKKGKGDALNNIGYVYQNRGDVAIAMKYFQQSHEVYKSIQDKTGVSTSLNNMGLIYYNIGNIPKALENFLQSLLIIENFNDVAGKLGVGALLNNIGYVYENEKNYVKALEYYQKSCKVREEINDSIGLSTTLLNIGSVYKNQGDISKGMKYSRKSLEVIESIGDKEGIASSLNVIGTMYEAEDSLSQALDYYKMAFSIDQELGNKRKIAFTLSNMGRNLLKQKKFAEAEKYCIQSLEMSKELGYPDFISKASNWLSQIYEAEGKYKEAYEMQILFKQYNDSIFNAANTKKLTQLQMQFDFDKQADSLKQNEQITAAKLQQQLLLAKQQQQQLSINQKELTLSNQEKDLQKLAYLKTQADLQNEQLEKKGKEKQLTISEKEKQLQLEKVKTLEQEKALNKLKQQQQWAYTTGGLILLGFISFWFFNRTRLQQVRLKTEMAAERIEQQQKEAEFQRQLGDISLSALRSQMNPHFIFNCLNSIKLYTTQNDTVAASEYLTKFSRLIRLVLENSRNDRITLAAELDALRLYMEMEAMRFKEKLKYGISVEKDVDMDYIEIPPLLLQPYVENAIWHGLMQKEEGGRIDIAVGMQAGESMLVIKITDNGIGRVKSAELMSKTATKHKSYGMKVTSERLALINQVYKTGANVTIDDLTDSNGQPGGTQVTIKIPLE
ncbi:hypothetical protein BH10BAC2_BH10BAC2_17820 [soil metagenome]